VASSAAALTTTEGGYHRAQPGMAAPGEAEEVLPFRRRERSCGDRYSIGHYVPVSMYGRKSRSTGERIRKSLHPRTARRIGQCTASQLIPESNQYKISWCVFSDSHG